MLYSELEREDVRRIKSAWLACEYKGYSDLWDNFDDFLDWSMAHGYGPQKHFMLYGANGIEPETPDHFCWNFRADDRRSVDAWDVAIAKIRESLGKGPIEPKVNPCIDCAYDGTCSHACIPRQQWWDYCIAKLKQKWGVKE